MNRSKVSVAIASLLFWAVIITAIAHHHAGPNKNEIASVQNSASRMMDTALEIYHDQGLITAVNYCNTHPEQIQTQGGLVEISYNITGDCYSPADTVVTKGNETILPVSVYGQINANDLRKLDQGYRFRDISISVLARLNGQMTNLVFLTKEVGSPSA